MSKRVEAGLSKGHPLSLTGYSVAVCSGGGMLVEMAGSVAKNPDRQEDFRWAFSNEADLLDFLCEVHEGNAPGRVEVTLHAQAESEPVNRAVFDVLVERRRQVEVEKLGPAHDDDEHPNGQLADAAGCYIAGAAANWPWNIKWWKPKSRRRDLVRAAALLIAEIERLDRADADEDNFTEGFFAEPVESAS